MPTSITTINGTDVISTSRTTINSNFSSLNSNKIETDTLDTDTTLAANSDSKIATQKAVKAYVDSGGNVNASETTRGIVEEATDAEVTAGTATGATGAKLFVTPAKLATRATTLLAPYQTIMVFKVGATTYDTSTASGTQNIAHGLGAIPKIVRIFATAQAKTTAAFTLAYTIYNGTTQASSQGAVTGAEEYASANFRLGADNSTDYATGVVTCDATNIIITWTKTGNMSGTAYLTWEVQG